MKLRIVGLAPILSTVSCAAFLAGCSSGNATIPGAPASMQSLSARAPASGSWVPQTYTLVFNFNKAAWKEVPKTVPNAGPPSYQTSNLAYYFWTKITFIEGGFWIGKSGGPCHATATGGTCTETVTATLPPNLRWSTMIAKQSSLTNAWYSGSAVLQNQKPKTTYTFNVTPG